MQINNIMKLFLSILFLSASGFCLAGNKITLGGGIVNPKYGELYIGVTQLKPGINYALYCGITSRNPSKMHVEMTGAVLTNENIPAKLNEVALKASLAKGATGALKKGENELTITSFIRNKQFSQGSPTYIKFLNLDDEIPLTVHDCHADELIAKK